MLTNAHKIICWIVGAGLLAGLSLTCVAQEPTNQEVEEARRTIKQLRSENEQLRTRVLELEKRMEGQSVRDRLVQEEQRVENLQAQLVTVGEKDADLQGRLEEINEQLRLKT